MGHVVGWSVFIPLNLPHHHSHNQEKEALADNGHKKESVSKLLGIYLEVWEPSSDKLYVLYRLSMIPKVRMLMMPEKVATSVKIYVA